ncbi:hypothetical protein [Candidatus Viridilinea mediisalina]|uniref:Uncharacterized protein n=1 Tax=Candidatus Viridilinea mediisalina TaxID=2024553 RepID=A0A2A6RI03_9CHLR|nr:hypothetical protein [Candidatus Viridilinea mediisalina]PDW02573.1 hypothetical protein CJ255_13295 [Candidatus Viridilinea mediisalina]
MNPMQRFGRLVVAMALLLFAGLLAVLPIPVQAQGASLSITPAIAPQNSVVTLTLAGFEPREVVSLWLTQPDASVLRLGDVRVGSTGILETPLFVSSSFPTGVHSFSARGNRSQRLAITQFELTIGRGYEPSPGVEINVDMVQRPQGQCFLFSGSGYSPNERISVWIRFPANEIEDVGRITASPGGTFMDELCFGRLDPEGLYHYTAHGNSSHRTGIGTFNLRRGDYLGALPGAATLTVIPDAARQLDYATLIGTGFLPGETVSLWLTLPDGVVLSLFQGITVDGTFAEDIFLPPLAAGRHYFSAYGQTSGQRAVAAFDLWPGDGN